MKDMHQVEVGDEVVMIRNGSDVGTIVKIEGKTPSGRLRVGRDYFDVRGGALAMMRGGSIWNRCSLQPVTPELRTRITRYRMCIYLSNQVRWSNLSDENLTTCYTLAKQANEQKQINTGPAPTISEGGNGNGTGQAALSSNGV